MKSNYGTTKCPKCEKLIAIGDDISKSDGEAKWHHTDCNDPKMTGTKSIPDTPAPPGQQTLADKKGPGYPPADPAPDPLVAVQAFIDLMNHNKIIDAEKWAACSKIWNTERMQ